VEKKPSTTPSRASMKYVSGLGCSASIHIHTVMLRTPLMVGKLMKSSMPSNACSTQHTFVSSSLCYAKGLVSR
jgi:hypothetical protein